MLIKENITLYICEHCKKIYIRKGYCTQHELLCGENPLNRAECVGCKFMEQQEEIIMDGYGYGTNRKSKKFYCTELKQEMYPHKVVRMGLLEKYPETFENAVQMPRVCEHSRPHGI